MPDARAAATRTAATRTAAPRTAAGSARPDRRRRIRRGVLAAAAAGLCLATTPAGAQAGPITAPPAPVDRLDLSRYLGTWHQLAAIPQPFNLVCARDTQARYSLDARGDVTVRNSCVTWTGAPNRIKGTATVVDRRTNAQLHVSFPGVPNQDRRRGPANYVVTALGPNYSWALVTSPSRLSGFVLSRTPSLPKSQWRAVRRAIAAAGENDCVYLTSPTTGGIQQIRPLCV